MFTGVQIIIEKAKERKKRWGRGMMKIAMRMKKEEEWNNRIDSVLI